MYRNFKKIDNCSHISSWKYKALSDESIKPLTTYDNSLAPSLNYIGTKTRVKFDRSQKQDKITFTHGKTGNIYFL